MNENKTNINWYPGHMAKTKRLIKEKYDLIDVVYEVIDARMPKSSKIKDIEEMLKDKNIGTREVILGVRPEHFVISDKNDPSAIPCKIVVNEMMGSELHLHVVEDNGDKLIVRIPTVSLDDDQRKGLGYGSTIYVTFESKVMHFFDTETEKNLLV